MNKSDIKKITSANKKAWNQVAPLHKAAASEQLDKLFSDHNATVQTDKELIKVLDEISIKGKDIVHLCCNNGSELLSLKRMGAGRCMGIDISELAIEEGKRRSEQFDIDCEFICSDIYELSDDYNNSFDIVHVTAGCLGWLPDLNLFFGICNRLLRQGGCVLIHEIHPFSEMLPFDNSDIDDRLRIVDSYFYSEPIVETGSLDYIGNTDYESEPQYWFVHTLSSIIMGLMNSGFNLHRFIESPNDISMSHAKVEKMKAGVPLSLIIQAQKQIYTSG
ncbi:MAG: class I SAM-dependent methyltransferase [Bacteroidales bacterium]|jgi:SAM-dependent methyltransferase|nr:class I SAM-dependent methyltransferase [Bacteroidales bacterium]